MRTTVYKALRTAIMARLGKVEVNLLERPIILYTCIQYSYSTKGKK